MIKGQKKTEITLETLNAVMENEGTTAMAFDGFNTDFCVPWVSNPFSLFGCE